MSDVLQNYRPILHLKKHSPVVTAILVLNVGSSSIKFAVYEHSRPLRLLLKGSVKRGNDQLVSISVQRPDSQVEEQKLQITVDGERSPASMLLLEWLEKQDCFGSIKFVGHRVVHGRHQSEPQRVSASLVHELRQMSSCIPEHLSGAIEMIEAITWRHPSLIQIACFDTTFHRTMPRVAKLLPIPRRFTETGIQRYGFHGLSYTYIMQELEKIGDDSAGGRVILAHLGSGCSMTAVRNGVSIDTSMCFTPTAGLPMATRSGDLDPGLICYLLSNEKLTTEQLRHAVNYESGLLGISEISSDIRELLIQEKTDSRAAEAVAAFCYQIKKWVGAFSAVLGGLDTLVFTGGIGEHLPIVRSRICEGLEHLGLAIDEARNEENALVISKDATSRVTVRVIPTNEELMIAKLVARVLPTRRMQRREAQREDYLK